MAQTRWMCYGNNVHKSPLTTATGIPQGDPASPFALAVLMAAAGLRVQDQIKAPPQDFRQLVYLDDRTLLASSPSLLQRSIDLWAQESSLFKLKEHPGKMQKAHRDHVAFPHGIEVLGVYIGEVAPEDQKRARERYASAMKCLSRIGHLPRGIWGRLEDSMVFALPKVLYGCVSHWAPRDELRSYDTRLRARLATLRRVSSWCRALQFPARDWRLQTFDGTMLWVPWDAAAWAPDGVCFIILSAGTRTRRKWATH